MTKRRVFKRFVSVALCLAMILSLVPGGIFPSEAAADATVVTDPGTSANWDAIIGTSKDGARYAGRVWVDKSVYKNGDSVLLDREGSSAFNVTLDETTGEYFQVVFSALGSSMATNTTVTGSHPLDVVLVLDTSTSMDDTDSNRVTRMERMIVAANDLLEDLTALGDIRIAIVTFNADSETVIDLAKYTNGIVLSVDSYKYNSNPGRGETNGGIITAKDKSGKVLGKDSGYTRGTNLQDGIDRGMNILATATANAGRTPVAIVLADGRANHAVNDDWYTIDSSNRKSSGDAGIMLSTLLNAAYGKTKVEKHYDSAMKVYGIGIDLDDTSNDYIFLNPGASGSAGFNESNSDDDVEDAWDAFVKWCGGTTATIVTGSSWGYGGSTTWTFDHRWPATGITTADIAANINYVDNYQNVSGADLGEAFDSIYDELAVNAFNPITSSKVGATGVENTPLIYADNIGKYMEVKSVQAVQIFGTRYNVTKNADGTYSVAAGRGVNPTTQESWNSAEDVRINVIKNGDGTEQLRIYINQEILPIILHKITVKTENGVTTRTIEEYSYPPLRVFYTVGIKSDILLPDGAVDISKIDSDYAFVEDGEVSFFANAFGDMNTEDRNGDGFVELGDAHVGFVPSLENRFYYHQAHQEIFISATNKNGSAIDWEDGGYGVLWDESKYSVKAMTYADYKTVSDDTEVYTYITFNRPTGTGNKAEEVTYLVYTTWGDLKDSVTFFDKVNGAVLNSGNAIELGLVESTVNAYKNGKSINNSDLVSVVGLQSRRVSRLNNMFEYKATNTTGSAELSYAPAYNEGAHDDGDIHEHNEVIVWLGNNGRVTLPIGTGIKVTKSLVEVAQGSSADEKFEIHISIDTDKSASELTVIGGTAADVNGNVSVTAELANGESVYVYGVEGGDAYTVTETIHSKYTATYTGATAAVEGAVAEGIVFNEPVKPGGLYITKTVEHNVAGEAFPTDHEFDFRVTFTDEMGLPVANKSFSLENNYEPELTSLTTDANGVMTGKLRHGETVYIKDIPAGTNVSVEEIAPAADGNYTLKRYESTDYSGAAADNDGRVVISSGKNATVVVTNKYTPKATAVDLDIKGTKNFHLEGSDSHTAGAFTFIVEKWNGTAWEEIESKSAVLEYAANEGESTKYFTIEDVLAGETFDRAGAYSYQVREEIGSVSNVTYDRTLYTFTVNVADVNGQLVATVTDKDNEEIENGEYAVEFNNSYNTATVSIDIKKDVADTSNNPLTSKAGFEFVAQTAELNADGTLSVKDGGRSFSVFSDAAGEARMTDVYKEAGVYYYIISEAAGSADGWSYSDVKYNVTVVVAKDSASGKLSADMTIEAVNGGDRETVTVTDGTNGTIVFTNTYDPRDAEISLNALVKKELSGKAMTGGEFEFEIYADGDRTTALATGTNDASGNVVFVPEKLTFSEVDNYFFDIIEKSGENGGITYDSTVYDLVVEVYDAGDGTLGARYYFEDSVDTTVTFKNTYTVTPVEIVIDGAKTLNVLSGSKSQKAGEYTFGLFDEAGNKIGETTNLENGTFRFDAITYGAEDIGKTYTYTVREIAPDGTTDGSYSAGGVKWSAQSFTVTVKITDNGDGTLSAETEGNGRDNIGFVNTYSSKPVSVAVRGRKILENRDLVDGEFTFSLFETGSDFTNPVLVNGDITHDAEGWISIDLGTLGSGYHYFLVKENVPEDPAVGISYSGAVYAVSVNVFDNGKGQMEYSLSVVNLGSGASEDIVFTNVYNPVETRIPLGGTKIYNGGVDLEEGEFSVGLYYGGELIDTAEVKADGSFDFNELGFGAANVGNTYVLTVEEIIPEDATDNGDGTKTFGNVIYDASSYTVLITVEDEVKDGVLEITKTVVKNGEEAETISFTNTFVPDPIEYTVSAEKSYDKGLKGNDFDFTLVSADGKTNVNQTKKNDVSGAVTFDPVVFETAGEYKFTLTEKKDGILSFIRPSDAEYEITVTVVMENGVLSVADVDCVNTKNTGESDLRFENVYVMNGEGEITLGGSKKLTGDRTEVRADEFEFGLYDSEGNLIEAVKNDADGKFAFKALKFDETGIPVNGSREFTYTVKEIAGDNARYTYDSTVYTVVVTVKDNDEGGIDVSYTVNGAPDTEIEFTNTYKDPAPVTYTPVAKKIYNKPLKGGDFKFSLEGEINGTEIKQEKTNAADGSITFDELSFPEAGTYTFKVKEIAKLLGFIKYSKAEYEIVVTVTDTNGVLSLGAVTINDDPNGTIEFINTYTITGSSEVVLNGEKTLSGRELCENEFEFSLTETDADGKAVEDGTVLTAKNGKDGKFSFKLTYAPEDIGTHYYKVSEVKGGLNGVTYDETVYTVKVVVSDDDEGGIKTETTVEGNSSIVFANSYKAETVLDVKVIKTVKNVGSETIGPEGFEFVLANETTGLKTVLTSDKNGSAVVSLGYNEADIGKTYTYTLSEVKGDVKNVTYSEAIYNISVTVSVNENGELVAEADVNGEAAQSVVCGFENLYNNTPEPPKTGVNFHIGLWAMMMAVSVLGICGLIVFRRRGER